ncbi:MAG: glycosyltransferase family 39 protein [Planctomycetes bacterium]|nr:glycosyltransferase family 39 protein [Planctomycetota bacterium]
MNAAGPRRFGATALALWTAVFVAARGWLVVQLADVFMYGEEFAKGAAAKAWRDGVPLEHWQLAFHPYEGGGFVTSHLNALAFAAVGENLLALKLVALFFGVAILWMGGVFMSRWFGATAAHAFAALYVFAPASMQKLGLLDLGIHYQALLFSLAILHVALSIGFEPEPRARRWFAFGLVSGFGLYFSYQCALTILPAAMWLAWRARARFVSAAPWALLGAMLGLAPMAYMAWHTGWAVFDIHGTDVLGGAEGAAKSELVDAGAAAPGTSKLELLAAFWTSVVAGRSAWDLVGVFALPFAACVGAWNLRRGSREARHAGGLVLAAFALFLVGYLASGFTVGQVYHYFRLNRLCPAWMACVVVAAAGFANRGGRRVVLGLATWLALVAGAGDLQGESRAGAGGTAAERVQILVQRKGYDYRFWLGTVLPRTQLERGARVRVAFAFREPARSWLAANVGEQVWTAPSLALDDAIAEARALDPSGELLLGFGRPLKKRLGGTLRTRVEALATRPDADRALLEEAAGRFGSGFVASEDVLRAELDGLRGANFSDAFWRGFGWRLFGALGDGQVADLVYWKPMPPPLWASRERAALFVANEEPRVAALVLAGYDAAVAAHSLP